MISPTLRPCSRTKSWPTFPGAHQEFEPSDARAARTNFTASHKISFGDHADQPPSQVGAADDADHQVVLDDRHPLDAVHLHGLAISRNGVSGVGHHVAYTPGMRFNKLLRQRVGR